MALKLIVNDVSRDVETDPDRPLLEVLREDLGLLGTRYGCGEGECGACSVLVEGRRAFSCSTPVGEVEGKRVTTIEGLEREGRLHPVQQAFLEHGAFQCGYCTSAMVMAAVGLLEEKPAATRQELIEGMNRNLCRCCGYIKILEAVEAAQQAMSRDGGKGGGQ